MKPRERFLEALRGGIPDRVPVFDMPFSPKLQESLIGFRSELYTGEIAVKMADRLGLDGALVLMGGYCGIEFFETGGDTFTDNWGITYIKKGWPIRSQIKTPIKNRQDWEKYSMPDPKEPWIPKQIKDAVKANKEDRAIIAGIRGPVSMLSWFLMDIKSLSYAFMEDPDIISEICGELIEWDLKAAGDVVDFGGVDVFLVADDWGSSKSLLLSPKHLRKFFLEPYRDLVQGLKEMGLPVIMHNDGNIWEILDDLVDTGIDAYHPVEKAATMDLKIIKEKYKEKLCPIGNVNNKTVMVTGTPDEVISETIDCLKDGAPHGGYIISTDHSLHDDIPEENVWAFINTVKKYGKYKGQELEEIL